MNIFINVRNYNLTVEMKLHALSILNNNELQLLLKQDAEASTDEFVTRIKTEHFNLFNIDFKVSDMSMAVEIWAHVYAEKFAEAVKNFSSINLIDKIAEKIMQHAEIIDIGEKGHDDNRFVWDALSVFKSGIASLLFAKQNK